jgi:hypothetical protein
MGSERPHAAFRIAAGIAVSTMIAVADVEYDLCAGSFGFGAMGVDVRHHEKASLRFRAADLVRLLEELVECRIADTAHHHRARAETQKGVQKAAAVVTLNALSFKSKCRSQPGAGGLRVTISDQGNDRRGHAIDPCRAGHALRARQ